MQESCRDGEKHRDTLGEMGCPMRLLWLGVPLIVVGSIVLPAMVGGAWSPTRTRVVHKMLEYARIGPDDVLVDLGAGDGRILLEAARRYRIPVVGIEIDPLRWCYCRLRLGISSVRRLASVRMANFFDVDLSFATVVTFYLSQAAADKLKAKFEAELPAGARIVSYRRPIRGWRPTVYDPEDDVYVYTIERESQSDVEPASSRRVEVR